MNVKAKILEILSELHPKVDHLPYNCNWNVFQCNTFIFQSYRPSLHITGDLYFSNLIHIFIIYVKKRLYNDFPWSPKYWHPQIQKLCTPGTNILPLPIRRQVQPPGLDGRFGGGQLAWISSSSVTTKFRKSSQGSEKYDYIEQKS